MRTAVRRVIGRSCSLGVGWGVRCLCRRAGGALLALLRGGWEEDESGVVLGGAGRHTDCPETALDMVKNVALFERTWSTGELDVGCNAKIGRSRGAALMFGWESRECGKDTELGVDPCTIGYCAKACAFGHSLADYPFLS